MSYEPHERRQQVSISMCHGGCVCMQFGMTMVHLPAGDFPAFVTLLLQALPEIESQCASAVPPHARARA